MENGIEAVIPTLVAAVEAVMSPLISQNERKRAHQVCEDFRETSPFCAECGMVLSQTSYPPIIRHFGLQLLEHYIKYRWNDLDESSQLSMKQRILELVATGSLSIYEEQVYIKDGLARVVVEIIKRQWPQHWPDLLPQLVEFCQRGDIQTEIVMLVLLRLVEDVVVFQAVPAHRRRDIFQAFTAHMSELIAFLLKLLEKHTTSYFQNNSQSDDQSPDAQAQYRISCSIIECLCGFVDWIDLSHVFENGCMLLIMLCTLLMKDKGLGLPAAECLLIIVSRKGKLESRKPLLVLFSADAMETILQAARTAATAALDEHHYLFLKRLGQVLAEIGKQLSSMWGAIDGVGRPENFTMYLESILAFTEHPSQVLCNITQSVWASFLKHPVISEDHKFREYLPRLAEATRKTVIKTGLPSQSNCVYSVIDFDTDEEYSAYFSKHRSEVGDNIKLITGLTPNITFTAVYDWLNTLLTKPITSNTDSGLCNLSSPSFLEWDAASVFLERVMSKSSEFISDMGYVERAIDLFKSVLHYQSKDPLLLSSVLTCVSALFPVLYHTPDILSTVLDKIFAVVLFQIDGETKSTRIKAVKNVRRHASSIFVKMCKNYPDMLLPGFDALYSHIKKLLDDPTTLSQVEKSMLMEAIILVSNKFENFERQSLFIEEIIKPTQAIWLSEEFKQVLWNGDGLLSYIGLDQPAREPSDSTDVPGVHRSQIYACVNCILAIMRRCKWPTDIQKAKQGGFVVDSALPAYNRNPATSHINCLLVNLLPFIRCLHRLWLPENIQRVHPDFTGALDLMEFEKLEILGLQPERGDSSQLTSHKTPLMRMQTFISILYENSQHILGNCGLCLGEEFYRTANLAQSLHDMVFTNFDLLPDHKLKYIIRVFLKPYVQYCPANCYQAVVIPLLQFICPFMLNRLAARWLVVNERSLIQEEEDDDEDLESNEMLEDQIIRQLSREFFVLLRCVCFGSRPDSDVTEDSMMDDAEPQSNKKEEKLSELGQLVMRTEGIFPHIVMLICSGLEWQDTHLCGKCISLAGPVFKQLVHDGHINPQSANFLVTAVITGIHQHGQHEALLTDLLTLGALTYEILFVRYPDIKNILLALPNVKPNSVEVILDFQGVIYKNIFA